MKATDFTVVYIPLPYLCPHASMWRLEEDNSCLIPIRQGLFLNLNVISARIVSRGASRIHLPPITAVRVTSTEAMPVFLCRCWEFEFHTSCMQESCLLLNHIPTSLKPWDVEISCSISSQTL